MENEDKNPVKLILKGNIRRTSGGSWGIRTRDQLIKSQLLYQLS